MKSGKNSCFGNAALRNASRVASDTLGLGSIPWLANLVFPQFGKGFGARWGQIRFPAPHFKLRKFAEFAIGPRMKKPDFLAGNRVSVVRLNFAAGGKIVSPARQFKLSRLELGSYLGGFNGLLLVQSRVVLGLASVVMS